MNRETVFLCVFIFHHIFACGYFSVLSTDLWDRMMRENGWNNVELRDNRYNQVIHMVSAAKGAEEFYTTEDHVTRYEPVELARELDDHAAQVNY